MTDLDFSVAAVICRDGPTSAYRVRERFRGSLTSTWSSSAGTIYPVIQRLIAAGHVESGAPQDARGTQLLTITAAGRRAVRDWIAAVPPDVAAPSADPVRTRLQYAGLLAKEEAAKVVESAIAATHEAVRAASERLPGKAEANWYDYLATLGSIAQLKGRLDWLALVREGLGLEEPAARAEFMGRAGTFLAGGSGLRP